MWPEVEKAKLENRHELVLGGVEIAKRIADEQFDVEIFTLTALNFFDLHDTNLEQLPNGIGNLKQLQSLVLNNNKLRRFNEEICQLDKLKLIDLSRNQLDEIITEKLNNLTQLVTMNFSHNLLTTFPKLSDKLNKLACIDLSNNRLATFPDVFQLNLSEIRLNHNEIETIPGEIRQLAALKHLELNSNRIKVVPNELGDCTKLKVLNLKDNPVSDRRLLKLIDQCRTKQILDYIKAHSPKTAVSKGDAESAAPTQVSTAPTFDKTIRVHFASDATPKVRIDTSVKNVREYIVVFLVRNVKFTSDNFKKFIQLQNKLHETICQKRNLATLATHDFDKLPPGDLTYTTKSPDQLEIHPLNRLKTITGAELVNKLVNEANALRKEKKRNTYSGIHKYLYLIEGRPKYPCLLNAENVVVSFPPITNAENTRISVDTKTMLVEVTSSESIGVCKKVAESLVGEMLHIFSGEADEFYLEQVKCVDFEGNFKCVYPSKVDLDGLAKVQVLFQ